MKEEGREGGEEGRKGGEDPTLPGWGYEGGLTPVACPSRGAFALVKKRKDFPYRRELDNCPVQIPHTPHLLAYLMSIISRGRMRE